nr:DUF294 nucleotidyltransferase-like domain-containing protein [uncultured Flavobacterium sp.]
MIRNPIAEQISDFLKKFEPFNFFDYKDLLAISRSIEVVYLNKDDILFKVDQLPQNYFFVVNSGTIGLNIISDAEDNLMDRCTEGNILGLRPIIAKDKYLMTATAREDAIVFMIPFEVFSSTILKNKEAVDFFMESFASNTRNPRHPDHKGKLVSKNVIFDDEISTDIQYLQPIKYDINPMVVSPTEIIKFVAQTMTRNKIGSVLIHENKRPIGIVTDSDLRSKIATGIEDLNDSVDKIMSSPVVTVAENISLAEAQMMMLKHNVMYLGVTKDGTPNTEIKGIISEHDVVVAQADNPGILLKLVKKANSTNELKVIREKLTGLVQNAIDKNIPMSHISNIVNEITSAITYKIIEMTIAEIGEPKAQFAWFNIGSQGRGEQTIMTDVNNFIVFEDVDPGLYEQTQLYFIDLSEKVIESFVKIGYKRSSQTLMGNNMAYCKSLTDWKNQYMSWIVNPKNNTITFNPTFFDFDFIYGNQTIFRELNDTITEKLPNSQLFLAYLGNEIVKTPSGLSFFGNFNVEVDKDNKEVFDLRNKVLNPLINAARLFALTQNVLGITNSYQRYKILAELEENFEDLYLQAADAFDEIFRIKTEIGLLEGTDGELIDLNKLTKVDVAKIKASLKIISNIQDVIKNRYQLTYFS